MSQTPVFLAIHLIGLAITLSIGPRRHPALMCALAFPAGLAATVLAALILLVVGIPYTAWTLAGTLVIGAIALVVARRPDHVTRATLGLAAAWTAAFALIALPVSHWNLSLMNFDAHYMVMLGRVIGRTGVLDPETMGGLQTWGVFQTVTQSLAAFTRSDYMYSVQPMLGLSFVPVFALTLWHATGHLGVRGWRRSGAVALVTFALFSIYAFAQHLVLIHTNLGAAVYLFAFVVVFWIAEIERDPSGLPVAFLFLFALALQRVETPIVVLMALIATAISSELPRRTMTLLLAGFTVLVTGWYILLAMYVPPDGRFLTPVRCLAVATMMLAFFGWWLVSRQPAIRRLNRHLPVLVSVAVTLALLVAFVLKPDHMVASLRAWILNLFTLPFWGYAWFGIVAALLLAFFTPRPPWYRAFTLPIWLSLAYIMVLAYPRIPYRVHLLDSANRMTIHILPLLVFYLALKAIPATMPASAESGSAKDAEEPKAAV